MEDKPAQPTFNDSAEKMKQFFKKAIFANSWWRHRLDVTLPVSGRRKKTKKNAATFAPDVTFPIAAADVQLCFSCHGLHKYLLAMPKCHRLCRLAYLWTVELKGSVGLQRRVSRLWWIALGHWICSLGWFFNDEFCLVGRIQDLDLSRYPTKLTRLVVTEIFLGCTW